MEEKQHSVMLCRFGQLNPESPRGLDELDLALPFFMLLGLICRYY